MRSTSTVHIWIKHADIRYWIGCLIFTGHFPQKRPAISVSFAKGDPQLKASSESLPLCMVKRSSALLSAMKT